MNSLKKLNLMKQLIIIVLPNLLITYNKLDLINFIVLFCLDPNLMQMENKPSQQLTQRHKNCLLHECCFWVYHLLLIALGFAIFGKLISSFRIAEQVQNSSQLIHAKETVSLWQKGYIIDIKSVNTNNCPEGYSPLLEYTWTGTTEGCFCKTDVSNYAVEYILQGKCTSELINQGCKQVAALSEQKLQMWKGGKLICVKRAEGIDFYDSSSSTSSNGILLKKCAQNKKYQINILSQISCPISQISNTSLSSSSTILTLDTSHNQKLSYVTQNNYPIADFKVSEHSFCEFLSEINISPGKVGNYKLEISKYTPCSGEDARYVQFDKMNQEEFFTNNTRVYDKLTELPGYPRPSTNYVFKLGYIRYPEWSYNCRVSSSHNLHIATEYILLTEEYHIILVMVCVTVPCLALFALLFRLCFMVRHVIDLKKKMMYNAVFLTHDEILQQMPNLNVRRSKAREVIYFIIEQILRIAVLVIVIFALLKLLSTSVWIKEMFKYSCTETYINSIFRFYQQKIDSINELFVQVLFIWSVMWIIDIIWFILRFKYLDLAQKVQEKVQTELISNSEELDPIKANNKELQMVENYRAQESSEIILDRDRSAKIRNLDQFMGDDGVFGAGQTKGNFYSGQLQNSDYNLVSAPKKGKKGGKKGKNKAKNLAKS